MKPSLQKAKGSALVFTLVILFLLFFIISGMIGVGAVSRSGGIATDHSVRAFQLADSGIERTMKAIMDIAADMASTDPYTLSSIASEMGMNCDNGTSLVISSVAQGQKYTISVHNDLSDVTQTTKKYSCDEELETKVVIESTGVYMNTARTVRKPVDFTPTVAVLSENADGTGEQIALRVGTYSFSQLKMVNSSFPESGGKYGFSAVMLLDDDYKISIYKEDNQSGSSVQLDTGAMDLNVTNTEYNDAVVSVKVEKD